MALDLTPFSVEYSKNTDIKHRRELGQFFTVKSLRDSAIQPLPRTPGAQIAELSCGSGEFVDSIIEYFPQCHIDAYEIDPHLAAYCKEKYRDQNVTVYQVDTLRHHIKQKYQFVIGNPPYFEYDPPKEITEEFRSVIAGRVNIYTLFIKLGIDLLEDGGYLSFVIPTSMSNGAYFAALRKYIAAHCSIVDIIIKGNDHFDDALQTVMVFVLRKERNNGDFIFSRNGITVFSPKWKELKALYNGSRCLRDLGFYVKTGSVVWNQHKDKLSEDANDLRLVWSHNIGDGFTASNQKPQYIKWSGCPERQKTIAVNRVTGAGKNAVIKACLIEPPFVCENHVNLVYSKGRESISFEQLLPHIKDARALEAMRMITGNTQISKTELELLLPIWGVKVDEMFEE